MRSLNGQLCFVFVFVFVFIFVFIFVFFLFSCGFVFSLGGGEFRIQKVF